MNKLIKSIGLSLMLIANIALAGGGGMALVYTKGLPMTINYSVYDEQQTRDVRVIAGSVDRDVPTSIAIEEGSTAKIDNIIYNGHTYSFGEGFLLGDNQLIEVWQEHAEMHITYTTVVYGVETPE